MAHVLAKDLREAVLQAAIQGKLTKQLKTDTPIKATLHDIEKEKQVLAKSNNKKQAKVSIILEEEIPFDIPNEWEWVRWGMVATSIEYGASTKAMSSGNAKLVRITDVQNEKINWDSVPYCNVSNDILNRCLLREGDILFARTGGTVGKSVLVQGVPASQIPYIFAGYLIRTNCSQKLNISYLKYFMNSPLYWEQLIEKTIGSAQPNCNAKKLAHMIVPLPPIEEQARIVAKVDEIMAKIDEYEKLENQLVKLKEQFPQDMKDSLLQAGMTGKLTEQYHSEHSPLRNLKNDTSEYDSDLPSNWSVAKMMTVSELYTGNSISESIKKSKYTGLSSGYNYIGTKDVGFDCSIAYNNGVKIPYDEPKFKIAKKHSTLLCIEGGSAGKKAGITSEDVCFGNKLCSFNAREYINYKFQFYVIQSPTFKKVFIQNKSGMIGGVSIKKLKEILIPLPPIEEQQRVVDKLDELLPLVDKLAELN